MKIAIIAIITFLATAAEAACVCRCVGGVMQPICRYATDIAPMCVGTCMRPLPPLPPIEDYYPETSNCPYDWVCTSYCVYVRVC